MTTAAELLFTPYDEYLARESVSDVKHEWINGLVYAMSRGTPEHGRLSAAIVRALPQTDQCRVYSSDTLLYIEKAQHSTYADASIVCGAILTRGAKDKNGKSLGEAITNPTVVVEVLSKSTEQRDRNERFVLFQQIESLEVPALARPAPPTTQNKGFNRRFDVLTGSATWLSEAALNALLDLPSMTEIAIEGTVVDIRWLEAPVTDGERLLERSLDVVLALRRGSPS